MSSNGRALQPVPVSEVYDEVRFSGQRDQVLLPQLESKRPK